MKMIKLFICLFFSITTFNYLNAAPIVEVDVGEARAKKPKVAFVQIGVPASGAGKELVDRIRYNLEFADFFDVINEADKDGGRLDYISFNNWNATPYDFILKIGTDGTDTNVGVKTFIYDKKSKTQRFGKTMNATKNVAIRISQELSDQLLSQITGKPSKSFYSRLAFVCDKGGKNKELYLTDWDNSFTEQLTSRRSIVFSPSFSKDGRHIAFTSYANVKGSGQNLNLYLADLKTNKYKTISKRPGLHIGPKFHPTQNLIGVTMSFTGNPQLYLLNMDGSINKVLAQSWGINVEADFSPDGSKMAYVSSRTGRPMVYVKGIDESGNGQQMTFAGQYNSHPEFSPDGQRLLFSSWIDGRFDLFTIRMDKSGLERLTKNQGTNEEAVYSPDGNLIAFTSSRGGKKQVYVMNVNSTKIRQMSPSSLGTCEQPAWGPVIDR